MRNFIMILALLCASAALPAVAQEDGRLEILFWNLENFYDWTDNKASDSDSEFSSGGARHWSKNRFYAKCSAVAKTMLWAGSQKGRLPDILAVTEVENAFVLKQIAYSDPLRKLDYAYVHFESPDPRGIDTGVLYRKSALRMLRAKPCHVLTEGGEIMLTRDILMVQFLTAGHDSLALLVNHHPSKYSGDTSQGRRELAVNRLRQIADSLKTEGWNRIVATGDFNDTPDNPVYDRLSPALERLLPEDRWQGSIKFEGVWEQIDQSFVSAALRQCSTFEVLVPPFLMVEDTRHSGQKPLRTYSGPRYLGGVSDHLPVLTEIKWK